MLKQSTICLDSNKLWKWNLAYCTHHYLPDQPRSSFVLIYIGVIRNKVYFIKKSQDKNLFLPFSRVCLQHNPLVTPLSLKVNGILLQINRIMSRKLLMISLVSYILSMIVMLNYSLYIISDKVEGICMDKWQKFQEILYIVNPIFCRAGQ